MIRLYAECTAKLTPEYNKDLKKKKKKKKKKKTQGDSYSYIYIFSIHLAMTTIRQLQMLSGMSSVFFSIFITWTRLWTYLFFLNF